MSGSVEVVLGLAFALFCIGGFVAAGVALVLWGGRRQGRFEEALRSTGFEPLTALEPAVAERLLAMSQLDERTHRAVCRRARREEGYTLLLQGIEPPDESLLDSQLGPAVHAPGLGMPRLTLVPKAVLGATFAGWASRAVARRSDGQLRPVRFPEDPAFERFFEVLGSDELALGDYLDAPRRAALARMPGLCLTGEGDLFTFERHVGTRVPMSEEERRLRFAVEDARTLLGILLRRPG